MGYSTYTPYLSVPQSPIGYHPYNRPPPPPPGPVLPPIDFRRAFYPPSRSVSRSSAGSSGDYRKRRDSPSLTPPLLEAILQPLPPAIHRSRSHEEVKFDLHELSRRAAKMPVPSSQDQVNTFPLQFTFNNNNGGSGRSDLDPAMSSVRSSNDNEMPVIPPEIRFEDTLNSTADSPLDQDPNNLSIDGTRNQPFSRSPELRVTHKLAERKRRKEMKDLFDELREHLPPERGIKSSKWEILSKSIDYVTYLKKQNSEAISEIDRLRRELDIARGGTGQYTPYSFSFTSSYPGPGTYAAAPQQSGPQVPPAQSSPTSAQISQQPLVGTSQKVEQAQS